MTNVPSSSQLRKPDILRGTKYRTVGALGRGGMGEILDAEHCELGHKVAVKILHRNLLTPDARARFRLEAQALSRLKDRHLVQVTDCGETVDGIPYFVMERLKGRTLRQELAARGALPLGEAVDILLEVLAGLSVLHRADIVHRDLKPGNVFLCEEPDGSMQVKLLDLGIAKVLAGAASSLGLLAPEQGLTQGMAVGTPQYMAPEQARGEGVDSRADLYAAGLLLYRMVAGRGPFEECRDFQSLVLAQAQPIPPPSSLAPNPLSPRVDALVLRAVSWNPAERFQSADEFSAELCAQLSATKSFESSEEHWFAEGPLPSPSQPTPSSGKGSARLETNDQRQRTPRSSRSPVGDAGPVGDAEPVGDAASLRGSPPQTPMSAWLQLILVGVLAASASAALVLAVLLAIRSFLVR